MNTKDYIDECMWQLNNEDHYEVLDEDPTEDYQK